ELEKMLIEANVFYWAASLLSHTYSYISQVVSAKGSPPFEVPQLRFVKAGVAIVHDSTATKSDGKVTTMHRVYLVEELIEDCNGGSSEFIKFIHNGSAIPLLAEVDPLYFIAEFLSFTQHVQYEKTGGLAYVSDLQGMYTTIIMT
ncbi:hypothetical protein BDQ17DRAFT_1261868, partial [Cyathus striatus]